MYRVKIFKLYLYFKYFQLQIYVSCQCLLGHAKHPLENGSMTKIRILAVNSLMVDVKEMETGT